MKRRSSVNLLPALSRIALIGAFLAAATAASAQTAVITGQWVQVRATPAATAKAIALVYGNDAFTVLEKQEAWVRIHTTAGQFGWIPQEIVVEPGAPSTPEAKALAKATALQRQGYRKEAEQGLLDILTRYQGNVESYEALRHLLYYYPVGTLPRAWLGQLPEGISQKAREICRQILAQTGRSQDVCAPLN